MSDKVKQLLQRTPDDRLGALVALAAGNSPLSESRARALLLVTNTLDEPTLGDFARLVSDTQAVRVATFDLLASAEALRAAEALPPTAEPATPAWLSVAMTLFGRKVDYPLAELDPASPPTQFSPAGQVVHQTAAWVRRQVQRSATERDKLARTLAYVAPTTSAPAAPATPTAPAAIPVRYFEYNEPIAIDPNAPIPPIVERGAPITITEEELPPPPPDVRIVGESRSVPPAAGETQPPQVPLSSRTAQLAEQVRGTLNRESVRRATERAVQAGDALASQVRRQLATDPLPTARLRVVVQDRPDGRPLPAVQVAVRHVDSKRDVAGPTNSSGVFLCDVPVKAGGLTYEVTVRWPAELGERKENKRVTVTTAGQEVTLPFYARLTL